MKKEDFYFRSALVHRQRLQSTTETLARERDDNQWEKLCNALPLATAKSFFFDTGLAEGLMPVIRVDVPQTTTKPVDIPMCVCACVCVF